jgi:hypothetical protein
MDEHTETQDEIPCFEHIPQENRDGPPPAEPRRPAPSELRAAPAWLTRGHLSSWDLHVEHDRSDTTGAGSFTGGGWKLVWHTTESSMSAVDQMVSSLHDSNAEPHFVIGDEPGRRHFTVVQLLPLTVAGRTLEHPRGTPETNRANCVQVEICGRATDAHVWDDRVYRSLAALACLIEHRVAIPRKAPRAFTATRSRAAARYTGSGFVRARGHVGHEHAANQPSGHWDPGRFRAATLLRFMREIDH